MKLFDGKKESQRILDGLARDVKNADRPPVLAIILVGDDEASKLYIKLKKERGGEIGIKVQEYQFETSTPQDQIIKTIEIINQDSAIDGLIVQLPLPDGFNQNAIVAAIDPAKDVDGFHYENRLLMASGKELFAPVLPQAILYAMRCAASDQELRQKKAVALVNSLVFGQVLQSFLKTQGVSITYLLRESPVTQEVEKQLSAADVIITACGVPRLIGKKEMKPGVILIDAGIVREGSKVVGDVDRDAAEEGASFLTPVPGGLGPMTVAFLLKNTYLACLQHHGK